MTLQCNRPKDGPCTSCLRRYPPVECFVQDFKQSNAVGPRGGDRREGAPETSVIPLHHPQPPVYPTIPFSYILHDPLVGDVTHYHAPGLPPGCVVNENAKHGENLTPAQRALKFLDPGSKEAMRIPYMSPESPRPIGGILTMLNSFNDMPVRTSFRNTELFHFCQLSQKSNADEGIC